MFPRPSYLPPSPNQIQPTGIPASSPLSNGGQGSGTNPRPLIGIQTGATTLTFTNPLNGDWIVTRVSIQSDTRVTCRLYAGTPNIANYLSSTSFGDGDDYDAVNPFYLPAGTPLTVVWDNGPTPASCMARVEYVTV